MKVLRNIRDRFVALRYRLRSTTSSLRESEPTGRYCLVTGMGHCGTQWMARVLDTPDCGIRFYHEKTVDLAWNDWYTFIRKELSEGPTSAAPEYFAFIRARLQHYEVVGDSNAWRIASIPDVDRELGVHRLVFMVRNGLQNVYSSYRTNKHFDRQDWLYTDYLRWPWELAGRPGKAWERRNRWECWCSFWAHNDTLVNWLRDELGDERVLLVPLERATSDVQFLEDVVHTIRGTKADREELTTWQSTDVNRKVEGDRRPTSLWGRLSDAKRSSFTDICGDLMLQMGYELPQ